MSASNLPLGGIYVATVSVWGNRNPGFSMTGLTALYDAYVCGRYVSDETSTKLVVFKVTSATNSLSTNGAGSGTGTATLVRIYTPD